MDFKKLLEKSRKRVHKTHVLYRCSVCGKEQWYIAEVPSDVTNAVRHYAAHDGMTSRCRGRFRIVKRRVVLKVWCEYREATRNSEVETKGAV